MAHLQQGHGPQSGIEEDVPLDNANVGDGVTI
jgi:hypothetical protein